MAIGRRSWVAVIAAATMGVMTAALAVPVAGAPPIALPPRVAVPPDDWLGAVNHYRTQSGVSPVVAHAAWTEGIRRHLVYLANTPPHLRTGQYANAHTENPASPWYTPEGDAAGRASNLGGGSNDREAIEGWMAGPFHAIGILRPELTRSAFARDARGAAGLDVIRGRGTASEERPTVLFPGPGSVSHLNRFRGESPDPTEPCGSGFRGLPIVAMLPEAPAAGTTASLRTPGGQTLPKGADLCVVTADTFNTSDSVYGATGVSILRGANAVLVIPRVPLAAGEYQVTVDAGAAPPVVWSFTQAPVFDDVTGSAYYVSPVRWLAANGITGGVNAHSFAPGAHVTRAQMAAFLHRFAGAPAPSAPLRYQDVPSDAYYADAVRWLDEAGITEGSSPTTFDPGGHVTRGQMAAFLHRLAGSPAPSKPLQFHDVRPDAYYADAVRWLDEQGVTGGVTATSFAPLANVTRGQMAAFLHRLDARI